MSLLLIDDQGETWDGQSRKLRVAFDSPFSGGEFSSYAVANLGFVAINTYGPSCQIRLRPSLITENAQRAIKDWLVKTHVERVVLTWLDDDWSSELLRSAPAGLQRLEALISGCKQAKPHDFLSRQLGPKVLHPNSLLGELVRQWPALSVPSGQRALMDLLEKTLGNRYIISKPNPDAGKMLFHEFGEGLFGNYETWRMCAVGAPMEEQPDRNFGKWVAAAYLEAYRENRPMIADVDAIVRWPHAGRTRMRYKRIIVPLAGAGDIPMMLGGSLIENRIDLRVGLG